MFSCESERVAFTLNCTQAINTAVNGLFRPGAHVIISSLEHNSVLRPVHKLKERGIQYSIAGVEPGDDNLTIENFASLIKKNTKAIICTCVSNVFGTVLPVEKIGELCKKRGLIFILDAAQGAGHMPIDMKKMNIDVLCMPGHKGLLGPMGTGAILLSERADPSPLCRGGTGSYSMDVHQPKIYPDRLESGTLNFPGLAGLLSGVRFIKREGGERAVAEKEGELMALLVEDLSVVKGLRVYTELWGEKPATVLSLNVGELHSERTAMLLDGESIAVRAGYHCSFLAHNNYGTGEKGTVRVSPGFFNTKKDIKNLVFCLNKIAKGELL